MSAVTPKGSGICLLSLPKGEGYASCVSQRERDMLVLLLCATDHLPDEGSQSTAHKRADDEDPEVGEGGTTLKHCRSNRTGRVDRCACDGNQGDMDNHQREADSQAGVNMISAISPAEASPSPTLLAPVCVLVTSTPEARMA